MNRRRFFEITGGALTAVVVSSGCRRSRADVRSDGRLTARPRDDRVQASNFTVGEPIKLGLDSQREALLYLPKSAGGGPLPLLLFLHGATQRPEDIFWYFDSAPDEAGVAILAPKSLETTWDAISGEFGTDVAFLNRALARVFETVPVDPGRITIGGFSDGATYALTLGLINGDLFQRVMACSPGFVIDGAKHGKPRIFISHGTRDRILPIDRCGRRVAAELKESGYDVRLREFEGGHGIPAEVMREGLRWVVAPA